MTLQVKIYGAGSIGNHLSHACRNQGWQVTICDSDAAALERTRNDIYPSRYGSWDREIELVTTDKLPDRDYDLVIIGTPPDSHTNLVMAELNREQGRPKVILVEKPLCGPDLSRCDELLALAREKNVFVCVGYNHTLTQNSSEASEIIRKGVIGRPLTMTVEWVEHWGGIFAAHPWLDGPADSYLGYANRGGGACCEHSHGINIWQHFSHLLGTGDVVEVCAVMEKDAGEMTDYDAIAQINMVTETGLTGYVIQDVVTRPPRKRLRIQGDEGALVWEVNRDSQHDALSTWDGNEWVETLIPKDRPADFDNEIRHVGELCNGVTTDSPISLERGLKTMMVIAAAHLSAADKRAVSIDYAAGYNRGSIT